MRREMRALLSRPLMMCCCSILLALVAASGTEALSLRVVSGDTTNPRVVSWSYPRDATPAEVGPDVLLTRWHFAGSPGAAAAPAVAMTVDLANLSNRFPLRATSLTLSDATFNQSTALVFTAGTCFLNPSAAIAVTVANTELRNSRLLVQDLDARGLSLVFTNVTALWTAAEPLLVYYPPLVAPFTISNVSVRVIMLTNSTVRCDLPFVAASTPRAAALYFPTPFSLTEAVFAVSNSTVAASCAAAGVAYAIFHGAPVVIRDGSTYGIANSVISTTAGGGTGSCPSVSPSSTDPTYVVAAQLFSNLGAQSGTRDNDVDYPEAIAVISNRSALLWIRSTVTVTTASSCTTAALAQFFACANRMSATPSAVAAVAVIGQSMLLWLNCIVRVTMTFSGPSALAQAHAQHFSYQNHQSMSSTTSNAALSVRGESVVLWASSAVEVTVSGIESCRQGQAQSFLLDAAQQGANSTAAAVSLITGSMLLWLNSNVTVTATPMCNGYAQYVVVTSSAANAVFVGGGSAMLWVSCTIQIRPYFATAVSMEGNALVVVGAGSLYGFTSKCFIFLHGYDGNHIFVVHLLQCSVQDGGLFLIADLSYDALPQDSSVILQSPVVQLIMSDASWVPSKALVLVRCLRYGGQPATTQADVVTATPSSAWNVTIVACGNCSLSLDCNSLAAAAVVRKAPAGFCECQCRNESTKDCSLLAPWARVLSESQFGAFQIPSQGSKLSLTVSGAASQTMSFNLPVQRTARSTRVNRPSGARRERGSNSVTATPKEGVAPLPSASSTQEPLPVVNRRPSELPVVPSTAAVETLAKTSAIATVAASALSSGSGQGEMLAAGVLMLSRCTPLGAYAATPQQHSTAAEDGSLAGEGEGGGSDNNGCVAAGNGGASQALFPFGNLLPFLGVVTGRLTSNASLSIAAVGVHFVAVLVLHAVLRRGKTSNVADATARYLFPSLSLRVPALLFQGMAYDAATLIVAGDCSSSRNRGWEVALGLAVQLVFACVVIGGGSYYFALRCTAPYRSYTHAFATWPASLGWWLLPSGYWVTKGERGAKRWGITMSALRGDQQLRRQNPCGNTSTQRLRAFLCTQPYLMAWLLAWVVNIPPPQDDAPCTAQSALLLLLFASFLALNLVFRDSRVALAHCAKCAMLLLLTSIAVVSLIPMPSSAARAAVAGTILAVGSVLSLAAAGGAVALAAAERFKWRRQEEEAEAEESASWPVVGGAERSPTEQQERLLLSPGGGDALEMPHAGSKQLLPLAPYAAATLLDLRLNEIEFAITARLSIEAAAAKATTNAAVANPLGKTLHSD